MRSQTITFIAVAALYAAPFLAPAGAAAGGGVQAPAHQFEIATEAHGVVRISAKALGLVYERTQVVNVDAPATCWLGAWRDCGNTTSPVEVGVRIERVDADSCRVSERRIESRAPQAPVVRSRDWLARCPLPLN